MKNPLRQQGVKAEIPTNSLPTPTDPAWFAGLQLEMATDAQPAEGGR